MRAAVRSGGLLDGPDGPRPLRGDPERLRDEIAASGLTGRGGAGFPVARKLEAARRARGRPVVVANGAEGEPASSKDRVLLERRPHLVLDGLQVAAAACGADRAHVGVPAELLPDVAAAAAARSDAVPVEVTATVDHFLSGEATALVAHLEGRAPLPGDKTRRLTESGLGGRPTVVQNVETLAHLALIARHGARWFRSAGTDDEPGTMLVSLSGAVDDPGVREVPHGAPLADVVEAALPRWIGPVLVGGFHGAWLAPAEVGRAQLSRASLQEFGASPGAGVLVVAEPGECPLAATARIAGWLADSGARQCGPCRNGLPRMADVLDRLARPSRRPRDPQLVADLDRLVEIAPGRGACHHPDGTARLVRSALRVFADDVDAHLDGGCTARRW